MHWTSKELQQLQMDTTASEQEFLTKVHDPDYFCCTVRQAVVVDTEALTTCFVFGC